MTVWPNITWPTSMVTFGVALTVSASRARGGGEAALALRAVAIELQMREMQRLAFGRFDGRGSGVGAARQAEIVAMDVQRMRHAERLDRMPAAP